MKASFPVRTAAWLMLWKKPTGKAPSSRAGWKILIWRPGLKLWRNVASALPNASPSGCRAAPCPGTTWKLVFLKNFYCASGSEPCRKKLPPTAAMAHAANAEPATQRRGHRACRTHLPPLLLVLAMQPRAKARMKKMSLHTCLPGRMPPPGRQPPFLTRICTATGLSFRSATSAPIRQTAMPTGALYAAPRPAVRPR